MNEQADDTSDPPTHAPDGRDWFLQQLVALANKSDIKAGFPVTLCVNGLLVTGTITGGREYFRNFGESVAGSLTDADEETSTRIRDSFASLGDLYKQSNDDTAKVERAGNTEAESTDGDTTQDLPEFIHLREAKISDGTNFVPTHGSVWWRGRIAEVDGFILGTLTRER